MTTILRRGVCLVLSAPSGGGKTAIARRLEETEAELSLSVSMTTRAARPGERDGVDYHFRTQAEFDALVAADGFVECAQVFGHAYGTPRAPVDAALQSGQDLLFDIDWQGHRTLRAALPGDVVSVFILPPSLAVLEERLRARGDGAEVLARRMEQAQAEISHWPEFDYTLVNTEFDAAVERVRAILHAARVGTARQTGLGEYVTRLGG